LGYGLVRADRALDYVSERVFNHRRVTFTPSQYGQLMSVDSLPNVDVLFRNDPVIPHNQVFSTIPYRIRGVVRYRFPYQANPDVWTRMSGTRGSRMLGVIDDFEVVDWARIDSTQVARDSALVETYVYRIPALNNTWYPVPPESVAVAITVAGFPEGTADVDALDAPRIVGVYPNPAREKVDLQIDGAHTGNRRVSVYDAMGRRVVRLEVPPDVSRVRWDLRDAAGAPVAAGLYWLRVDGHRDLLRRRVIILR